MYFEIIREITGAKTIATGSGIRELARLRKFYGHGRWRKRKGIAQVRLSAGDCLRRDSLVLSASESASSRSNDFSEIYLSMASRSKHWVVCVENEGYAASLERRKLYVALADVRASRHKQIRVIDESGEDYLYPEEFFVPVDLPEAVRRRVLHAA